MKNKTLGMILWLIGADVECLLLLCLARTYSAAVWITFGFTLFVFLSQLALWLYTWRSPLNAEGSFLHMPLFTLSVWYMILQAVPCVVFAVWPAPARIALLTNAALSVVMWVLLIFFGGIHHEQKSETTGQAPACHR